MNVFSGNNHLPHMDVTVKVKFYKARLKLYFLAFSSCPDSFLLSNDKVVSQDEMRQLWGDSKPLAVRRPDGEEASEGWPWRGVCCDKV